MQATDADAEALRSATEHIEGLTAERVLLVVGAELAQAERDTFGSLFCNLEVDTTTHDAELVVVDRAVQSPKERVKVGET